ncbi:MAG: hypothetical protein R2697_07020 [Ilumatobacteraceae bacterium]
MVKGIITTTATCRTAATTLTISLPSLRVDAFTVGLAGEVQTGRRSGLTFARGRFVAAGKVIRTS